MKGLRWVVAAIVVLFVVVVAGGGRPKLLADFVLFTLASPVRSLNQSPGGGGKKPGSCGYYLCISKSLAAPGALLCVGKKMVVLAKVGGQVRVSARR